MPTQTPYQAGGVITDPNLLALRGGEIDRALNTIAPQDGPARHVALIGDRRCGRTSVLTEVLRRVQDERCRIVVRLRPLPTQLADDAALIKHLLIAAVEAVAASVGGQPDWYEDWRRRVYLRDTSPGTAADLLNSSLIFARDPDAVIDPILLAADLRALATAAEGAGFRGIVASLDDAGDLTADTSLTEQLLAGFDEAGGWHLIIAALPTTIDHFAEAVSPCLHRFAAIAITEFWRHEIVSCLSAPLETSERERWIAPGDLALVRDLERLTGGNPFEVMLAATRMWEACSMGEADRFTLTPRVLDRVVRDLAFLTGGRDLLDGAMAIRRLARDQMPNALELVAFSGLTAREIAIARCLNVDSRDATVVRKTGTHEEVERLYEEVLAELHRLEQADVITLSPDRETFSVRGGRAAFVLLKYEARAALGPQVSDRRFGLGYLSTVGRALLRDVFTATSERIGGTDRLASHAAQLSAGRTVRQAPRAAARSVTRECSAAPIFRGELDLSIGPASSSDTVREALMADRAVSLALVSAGVSDDQDQFEYVELWMIPAGVDQDALTEALAAALDDAMETIDLAGLRWRGTEGAIIAEPLAHDVLVAVAPFAAILGVGRLFESYVETGSDSQIAAACAVASKSAAALRPAPRSWQRGVFLGPLLSNLGFLLSFDDDQLEEARSALLESLAEGEGDDWVTRWNVANVAARIGELGEALNSLNELERDLGDWDSSAHVLMFVPGLEARKSMIHVNGKAAARAVLGLQRALIGLADESPDSVERLSQELESLRRSEVNELIRIASVVESSNGCEIRSTSG
jgi:hypothetical protein